MVLRSMNLFQTFITSFLSLSNKTPLRTSSRTLTLAAASASTRRTIFTTSTTLCTSMSSPEPTATKNDDMNRKPFAKLYSLDSSIAKEKLKNQGSSSTTTTTTTTMQQPPKVIHFIRHAQGYHNVDKDYKNPALVDAQLTLKGIEQCKELSIQIQDKNHLMSKGKESMTDTIKLFDVECIISSPMRRALQTAQHSFQHVLEDDLDNSEPFPIPFIACEAWRETVNYVCDQRLPSSQLQQSFPFVNFEHIIDEIDPIWEKYESIHGTHDTYEKRRESNDDEGLRQRAKLAWDFIHSRNESCIAIVSHSAFFFHMFMRPEMGIVAYHDDHVEKYMTEWFENCEMRSLLCENIIS